MTAAPLEEVCGLAALDAPERAAMRNEWHVRVHEALRASLSAVHDADLAFDALLYHDEPERVARRHRVSIEDVQRAARRARSAAKHSPRLRALAEEVEA